MRLLSNPVLKIDVNFEPRDLWVGAYVSLWEKNNRLGFFWAMIYICFVPTLPIGISISWKLKNDN